MRRREYQARAQCIVTREIHFDGVDNVVLLFGSYQP
jgi:hypothetical protein